jgi:hypothetical protein
VAAGRKQGTKARETLNLNGLQSSRRGAAGHMRFYCTKGTTKSWCLASACSCWRWRTYCSNMSSPRTVCLSCYLVCKMSSIFSSCMRWLVTTTWSPQHAAGPHGRLPLFYPTESGLCMVNEWSSGRRMGSTSTGPQPHGGCSTCLPESQAAGRCAAALAVKRRPQSRSSIVQRLRSVVMHLRDALAGQARMHTP